MAPHHLYFKNVITVHNGIRLIDKANFTLKSGEILGIIDAAGSGKTVLIETILGYRTFNSGDILADDISILEIPDLYKMKVRGVLAFPKFPKDHSGFQMMTAYADQSGILDRNESKRRIHNLVEILKMGMFIYGSIDHYSYFQKLLLTLALSLINKPQFLVVDNCVSNLTESQILDLKIILSDLTTNKTLGIAVASSYHKLIKLISTRTLIFQGGKLTNESNPSKNAPKIGQEKIVISY